MVGLEYRRASRISTPCHHWMPSLKKVRMGCRRVNWIASHILNVVLLAAMFVLLGCGRKDGGPVTTAVSGVTDSSETTARQEPVLEEETSQTGGSVVEISDSSIFLIKLEYLNDLSKSFN